MELVCLIPIQIIDQIGAYSHSQGFPFVRQAIADFIERRDGFPADPDSIFMYNGASPGIQHVLRLLVQDDKDGVNQIHYDTLIE